MSEESASHEGGVLKNPYLALGVFVLVVALGYLAYALLRPAESPTVPVLQGQAAVPAVPTVENPVEKALPQGDAFTKTNPFSDAYVNPFK